jgi:hypothetical protein
MPRAVDGQAPSASTGSTAPWYAGIATGYYFPVQQWPTAYRLGGGGTLIVGRSIGPHWAVQLDANQWLLSGSARSTWDMKAGPMVKWLARGSGAAPFVLAGFGIDAQTNYPSRSSTSSMMVPVGIGVEAQRFSNGAVFVEAMHYFVFRSVETRDIPLLLGFRLGF